MSLADQTLTTTLEDNCCESILIGQASHGDAELNPQTSESDDEVSANHQGAVEFNPQTFESDEDVSANHQGAAEFNPQTSESVYKVLADHHGDIGIKPQPSESVYEVLINYQTTQDKWELCPTFKWLQKWSEIFNKRFNLGLTNFTLAVDWLRGKRSGQFRRGFNGLGLAAEVTINRTEIERGNQQVILGILLHELLHGWQEQYGTPSAGNNNHHNTEFRRRGY